MDYRDKSTWEAIISLLFMIVGSPFVLKVHHQAMAYTCKQECHNIIVSCMCGSEPTKINYLSMRHDQEKGMDFVAFIVKFRGYQWGLPPPP